MIIILCENVKKDDYLFYNLTDSQNQNEYLAKTTK